MSGLVRFFCGRNENEELQWDEKAMGSLIKKLRNRKEDIIDLRNAIFSKDPNSNCITLPRSSKHKLPNSHKEDLPHVTYCRIWRWPDLMSPQELISTATCQHPYSCKQEEICINPYHYERVEDIVMSPLPPYHRFPDPDMPPSISLQPVSTSTHNHSFKPVPTSMRDAMSHSSKHQHPSHKFKIS